MTSVVVVVDAEIECKEFFDGKELGDGGVLEVSTFDGALVISHNSNTIATFNKWDYWRYVS